VIDQANKSKEQKVMNGIAEQAHRVTGTAPKGYKEK
jgi:hypothetical protein